MATTTHKPDMLSDCNHPGGEPWRRGQHLVLCCPEEHAKAIRIRLLSDGYKCEYDQPVSVRWIRALGYYTLQLHSSFLVTDIEKSTILKVRGRNAWRRALQMAMDWNSRYKARRSKFHNR